MGLRFPTFYGIHCALFAYCGFTCYRFDTLYPNLNPQYCSTVDPDSVKKVTSMINFHKEVLMYIYLACGILALIIAVLSWYFNKYFLPCDFA